MFVFKQLVTKTGVAEAFSYERFKWFLFSSLFGHF